MKLQRELKNAIFIFLGIGIYFLAMDSLGLADVYYLRLLNIFIVLYFVNQTIKCNIKDGKIDYLQNIFASAFTSLLGVFLSVIGLFIYINYKGGETYIHNLSDIFLTGSKPSVTQYCIGLLFEGIASSIIATFILMQYWKRYTHAD